MSQVTSPYRQPEATPVGHSGTRVEIHERPARAINGWAGVLVIAVCIAGAILLGQSSLPGLAAVPIVFRSSRGGLANQLSQPEAPGAPVLAGFALGASS